MTDTSATRPTADERIMAALALCFGTIAALIVWAIQKDRSRFVRFHALQALAFDLAVTILSMIMMMCFFGTLVIGTGVGIWLAAQNANSSETFTSRLMLPMLVPYVLMSCFGPIGLVVTSVRLVAAGVVASGRDFRYPWIAARVDAFLAG